MFFDSLLNLFIGFFFFKLSFKIFFIFDKGILEIFGPFGISNIFNKLKILHLITIKNWFSFLFIENKLKYIFIYNVISEKRKVNKNNLEIKKKKISFTTYLKQHKIYYIFMSMLLKFSYIPYKINKTIVLIYLLKNIVNKQDVVFLFMCLI